MAKCSFLVMRTRPDSVKSLIVLSRIWILLLIFVFPIPRPRWVSLIMNQVPCMASYKQQKITRPFHPIAPIPLWNKPNSVGPLRCRAILPNPFPKPSINRLQGQQVFIVFPQFFLIPQKMITCSRIKHLRRTVSCPNQKNFATSNHQWSHLLIRIHLLMRKVVCCVSLRYKIEIGR